MPKKEFKCILISDFTIDNLAGYLKNDTSFPSVASIVAPFNQVIRVFTDKSLPCWQTKPSTAVVWTCPERVIESYNRFITYGKSSIAEILEEVDVFSSLLAAIRDRVESVFVPTWALPFSDIGFGMLEMQTGVGISNTLMRMNLRLAENLEKQSGIYLMDVRRWLNTAGRNAFNPKLWYMGKIAFGNAVFSAAASDIKSALRGLSGESKKLIVLDLDDTLWGGIVGEVGWEGIRLGGHDHVGEALVDFQKSLKALVKRGVLLGIASKNEELVALEAIRRHPEMVLRLDDFAGWKINWHDKAKNILELVSELNIGLQSVIFIDDNPAERARVREALPEVFVPEWPEDKMMYKSTLCNLCCFNSPLISKEDMNRVKGYAVERKRLALKSNIGSLDAWLKELALKITVEDLNNGNLQRITQLMNKTNQMNLTTRRLTDSELQDWVSQSNRKLWGFCVSDKFGDSGLVGIISIEEGDACRIVDFILSCRVFGRKIEEAMLYTIIEHAYSRGMKKVYAKYVQTMKNKPCLDFWKQSGFSWDETTNLFQWEFNNDYPLPEHIQISCSEKIV